GTCFRGRQQRLDEKRPNHNHDGGRRPGGERLQGGGHTGQPAAGASPRAVGGSASLAIHCGTGAMSRREYDIMPTSSATNSSPPTVMISPGRDRISSLISLAPRPSCLLTTQYRLSAWKSGL